MLLLKIIPLKFLIIGVVVILLGIAAYMTFVGDRGGRSIDSASPTPVASEDPSPSPSESASPAASVSIKATPKPSAKASVSPSPSAAASSSPAASTNSSSNSSSSSVTISEVSPTQANFLQEFTLKGNNFGSNTGSIAFYNPQGQVSAGAVVTSWNNTEIKAKVPNVHGGYTFELEVSTSNGLRSNRVSFRVDKGQPQLDSISPANPSPGSSVTLSGSELGSSNGSVTFYDGTTPAGTCSVSSWSDTQISCTVPSSLSSNKEYGIQITTSDSRQTSFKYYTLGS